MPDRHKWYNVDMLLFKNKHSNNGFSLVELVIVLAISALLLTIVGGFYAQRRNVASDDVMQQMISRIQTVQNETQSNLGPTSSGSFTSGETFYGEAIEFSNTDCISADQSCMIVHKLKLSSDGKTIIDYEKKKFDNSQGLFYYAGPSVSTGCTGSGYVSCFSNATQDSSTDFTGKWVVIRSGSGAMYYMNTATCAKTDGYNPNCSDLVQGKLQQAVTDSSSGSPGNLQYYVNIDMLNANTVTSARFTGESTPAPTPGFK